MLGLWVKNPLENRLTDPRKNKLKLRVAELERKVADLTEALQVQLKNKKKREEKKKRKKAKKAQRKHRKKAEAQNIAVRIKSLLYKEEET